MDKACPAWTSWNECRLDMWYAGALILMIIAVPFVLPTLLPLIVAFFWLRHRYITTGREVKRFDATTRSPVYASFSAALKVGPSHLLLCLRFMC